ncbi:MAG: SH3 domain-containing protein [Chloroflexi bacterium]|nr:SH3 domain-containing protein [Chloroflexota bacterium]MBI1856036.1 SH3 domain-containing protein [Chloroflexota bacterium]MBI3341022.1 SH3 domain-containing protein [Chloroflexota bacterium]
MKKIICLILSLGLSALACSASLVKTNAQTGASLPTETAQTITGPTGSASPETCTVTAANLNLRSAPSPDANVITWLHAGNQIIILEDPPVNDWNHVQAGNLTGWINSIYCKRN